MKSRQSRQALLVTTMLAGTMAAAAPALAQDATVAVAAAPAVDAALPQDGPVPDGAVLADAAQAGGEEIVVTGSLFARRTDAESASPVTTLSAETLDRRGINSVADAIRSVSADNSGSIPVAFANGFASGASGVSLRGLGVNSTLVLFDGLRGSYYPLADDGQKSFVDLNTIPQFAVERVEVLRDGASATYGADAIGGVVNVITRKEFQGLGGGAEAGLTERGDVGNQRLWLLAGTGDLDAQGFSAYLGGEFSHSDDLMARARGFPYNTADVSRLTCTAGGDPHPCSNGNVGAQVPGQTISALVRRATQTIPGNVFSGQFLPGATYQVLNPAGCAPGLIPHTGGGASFCEQDKVRDYGQLQPEIQRYGVTGRVSARLGGDIEGYAIGTYYRSDVTSKAGPSVTRNTSPVNTLGLVLPARLANGQLNPNNPFAAEGVAAQISYTFGDIPVSNTTASQTYRGALGVSGSLGARGRFAIEATGMHTDLDWTRRGYVNVPALGLAVLNGTYNFVNPSLNSDAVRRALAPDVVSRSTSDLYMAQATATYAVADFPGGPLQIGGTASVRHERLNSPNANSDLETLVVNPVNAKGHRTVAAAAIEIEAPVLDALQFNFAGRYDHYSDGYKRFSPKAGVKFTPIKEVALRGTYSQGFRAPQFAELNGSVTGYTLAGQPPCSIVLAHGGTDRGGGDCSGGTPYVQANVNSLGINTTGTPALKPERSRSFTVGAIFQPVKWFSATVDYYNISKKDFIAGGPDYALAIEAYYAGQPLPAGYTVVLNDPDPLYPNAPRTVGFVNAFYVNASEQRTSGIDFSANFDFKLGRDVQFISQFEATRIFQFNLVTANGTQEYAGTQGPYALSSGAGTPAWRANWQNTLILGPATLSATAYYTDGYINVAEDASGVDTREDCEAAQSDPAFCRTRHFLVVDMVASYKVSDQFTFYVDVNNLFDAKAPYNPPNYAAANYNPTWSQSGVIGRAFRAGARFRF